MHVHRVCLSLHLIKKTVKQKRTFQAILVLSGERESKAETEIRAEDFSAVANYIIAVAYAM